MKQNIKPFILHDHFLIPSLDRYPMSHAPFLAHLDEERVVVVWFAGSREWAKDVHLLMAIYHPQIGKWEPIQEFVSDIGYSLGNSVFQMAELGRFHLWYVRTKGYWHEGEIVHMVWRDLKGAFISKKVIPLERGWLVRGRPVVRGDVAYLPVYQEATSECAIWEQQLSSEEGRLLPSMTAPGGLIHPVLLAPGGDEFRCLMRNLHAPNRIHLAYSMDRGATWSRPFPTSLPNPNSGLDALLLDKPLLGEDRLVCVYNDSPRHRYPLSLSMSLNGGVEWSKIGDLESLPDEYSYPSLLQDKFGVHVAYTFKRKAIKFLTLNPELF